ncbi:hypothetical protein NE865_04410 [Phthorimaea operculella]|nr:hypothetical protein NE865_04410 [Phthorimaea operculella]
MRNSSPVVPSAPTTSSKKNVLHQFLHQFLKKKKPARKMSDSEFDYSPVVAQPQVQVQRPVLASTSKGKRKSEESGRSQGKKSRKNIFAIIQAEENAVATDGPRNELSSFITKVSQGHTRRATALPGDFFVELKVYKAEDLRNVPADQRYKKALVAMKLYCKEGTKEWDSLQEYIGTSSKVFEECESVFFNYK